MKRSMTIFLAQHVLNPVWERNAYAKFYPAKIATPARGGDELKKLRMKIKILLIWTCICAAVYKAPAQNTTWKEDAAMLHRSQKALTDVIIHDIFSPPVAARVYAYANIAAYEVIAATHTGQRSLYQQVKDFPAIKAPKKKIEPSLAAVYAFLLTGEKLIFSEPILRDSMNAIITWYQNQKIPSKIFSASVEYASYVSAQILQWAALDQYRETRRMRRYNIKKEEGKWLPTPPGYIAAVEPYWNKIRTITMDSATQFRPPLAIAFSSDTASVFYRQAREVYTAVNSLSHSDSAIASFWDCNPFFLNTRGHMNFATKKISPGGHWMAIAGLACRQSGASIAKSAAAYTYTAIALFDGFICCWEEKYRSNLIRPETYINSYIDENWRPLLQTPPFPEYTSGHSVVSTAAAKVLSHVFGKEFAFNDDTEVEFGLPVRSFTSFKQACDEAAISRLYGGIHYRAAIEHGQVQGEKVGAWVLQKIKLEK